MGCGFVGTRVIIYLVPRTGFGDTHKMSALVPYAAPMMANYVRRTGGKRARVAYSIAHHVYQNRKRYGRAARVVGRAFRSYRKRKALKNIAGRHRIGEQSGRATCKRNTVKDTAVDTENTRTLYVTNLTLLQKNVNTDDIDRRDRNIANIRGFKLHLLMRNTTAHVMGVNLAIISPKQEVTALENDFFRGTGNQRGLTFDFSLLSSNDFLTRSINTDKFNILMHKKYTLHPLTQTAGNYVIGSGKNWMKFNRYIPMKRQFRYDTNASSQPITGNVYFVHWYDGLMESAGTVPFNGAMRYMERSVIVFREPK